MNTLDTELVIELLREKRFEPASISTITLIEMLRGLETEKRTRAKQLLEESFNVRGIDNKTIETYCSIYRTLKQRGESVPDADLLIAATAISDNTTLRTRDQHFQRLVEFGLKLAMA
jgi:predicted nucleic acid-binding protein